MGKRSARKILCESLEQRVYLSGSVVGRDIFYANSPMFDTGSDDAAIAIDKTALLPGQTATFANYTSYSRGINGIMVDLSGVVGTVSASDFTFKVGNDSNPGGAGWTTAPAPIAVLDRTGAGVGGSMRIELKWSDNAIQDEWLQVTVLADANTGLAAPDVFYFGNAIGETGDSPTDAQVTAADEARVSANACSLLNPASITNVYDFNRDGKVDASDQLLARNHVADTSTALQLINVPGINVPGTQVTVSTRALTSFTELVITGTSSVDSILVTQSGSTFTITSNGTVQTISGTFGDMKIYAGSAGGNITVDSSVTINNMVYGGTGVDTITDHALASYNAIITVGGSGVDTVTGNGINTDYWTDATDTVNASAAETSGGLVNKISAFYQPWTTDTTSPDYVPLALGGQNLRDPTDIGTAVHYAQGSLWGVTPTFWDVQQGGLSDCFLLADIQSLAISRPAKLEALAVDLGDGTYAVEFKRSGVTSVVRVDGDFSTGQASPGASGSIWPLVFEKAYALFRTGQNTFNSLNQGDTSSVFTDLGIANTGVVAQGSPATVYATISTALAAGKAVALMSLSTIAAGVPIITNHAYSVMSITHVGTGFNIVLRNPWGFDGAGFDSNPLDGILTLTVAQLQLAFWFGSAMS